MVFVIDGIRDAVFRVGHKRSGLFFPIRRFGQWRLTAAIPYSDRLQHVAVAVHFQRDGMTDARVVGKALVVIAERFTRMGEEDSMLIESSRLHGLDAEVLLGNRVGMLGFVGAIQSID